MKEILNQSQITQWFIERDFIWQMELLSEKDFCRMAKDRVLILSDMSDDISRLWQIGLLRADLVKSKKPLKIKNLIFIKQNDYGEYLYSDERNVLSRKKGLAGVINKTKKYSSEFSLMFHPFRVYVLHRIQEIVKNVFNITTLLRSVETWKIKFPETSVKSFQTKSSKEDFRNEFKYLNDIVSLAVAAEPFTYNILFGIYSIPYLYWKNEEELNEELNKHFENYKQLVESIGVEKVKQMIAEICREAEILEPNKDILQMLRFTEGRYRLEKVKGNLGRAVYLLVVAETLRRSLELSLNTELPEEDEMAYGYGSKEIKEYRYGTTRLADKNVSARREFLRRFGLDYNIRLRWYVEGNTEYYALKSVLRDKDLIEVINLKGDVIAKRGKGVSFAEELQSDNFRAVYSYVSIDGDKNENIRVVDKAIETGIMFGEKYVSKIDFEFENFTVEELAEVAWEIALKNGATPDDREKLFATTKSATNGKEFEELAKKSIPSLATFSKGQEWGEKLMDFAQQNTMKLIDGTIEERMIITSIRSALHTASCSYHLSRKDCKVDLVTGKFFIL